MGTYLRIPKKSYDSKKAKDIYKKHFKLNKNQFRNDFGNINTFANIFGDIWYDGTIQVKIEGGIPLRRIFSDEFVEDLKNAFPNWRIE